MPLTKINGTAAANLAYARMLDSINVDKVYIAQGATAHGEILPTIESLTTFNAELAASYTEIGELAEKPFKIDSKVDTVKTRHRAIPTRRKNTITLMVAGVNCHQKNFFESAAFGRTEHTILIIDEDITQGIYITGCVWKADWQGEADGIFTLTLTAEFAGATAKKVLLYPELIGMNI